MDNDDTRRSAADWFNEGIKCFNKPDGVGAVRAFEAVVEIDSAYRHKDGDNRRTVRRCDSVILACFGTGPIRRGKPDRSGKLLHGQKESRICRSRFQEGARYAP